jgi:hypothetical protein
MKHDKATCETLFAPCETWHMKHVKQGLYIICETLV